MSEPYLFTPGTSPQEIRGTKTGFYYGSCFQETERAWAEEPERFPNFKNSYEGFISSIYGLKGPVIHIETACSSSLSTLTEAFIAIKSGLCESALVAGYNLSLVPSVSLGFMDLQMISPGDICKCLDKSADGYARSEAISCIFLEKSKHAKPAYMEILASKCNSDGFKPEGLLFPSVNGQARLMEETYQEIGLDPRTVNYVEAHITGTPAGDVVETSALSRVFCKNGREKPLMIGCVKSNLGHSEGASGVTAIIKSAHIFQKGLIPPSLHFKEPNPRIEGLVNGMMKPVLKPEPFSEDYLAINSFGFGGSNVHTVVNKVSPRSSPEDFNFIPEGSRLICIPGRTFEAVEFAQSYLSSHQDSITKQFLHLIDLYSRVDRMPFRCFTLAKFENGSLKLDHKPATRTIESKSKPRFNLVVDFTQMLAVDKAFEKLNVWKQVSLKFIKASRRLGMKIENFIYGRVHPNGLTIACSIVFVFCLNKLFKSIGLNVNLVASGKFLELLSKYMAQEYDEEMVLREALTISAIEARNRINPPNSASPGNHCITRELESGVLLESTREQSHFLRFTDHGIEFFQPSFGKPTQVDSKIDCPSLSLDSFLEFLGRCYTLGANIQLTNLYPGVQYPVPVDTLSLNSMIKWDHSRSFKLYKSPEFFTIQKSVGKSFKIDLKRGGCSFLLDHAIDGSPIFPATGYLVFAWLIAAQYHSLELGAHTVCFKDVKLLRASLLTKNVFSFSMHYLPQNGKFCVKVGNDIAAEGKIHLLEGSYDPSLTEISKLQESSSFESQILLHSDDIYKEFRIRGYDYGPAFQCLVQADFHGKFGLIKWPNEDQSEAKLKISHDYVERFIASQRNWITFTDSALQLCLLCSLSNRSLMVPIGIETLIYDPKEFLKSINNFHAVNTPAEAEPVVKVSHDFTSNTVWTEGLWIKGLSCVKKDRRNQQSIVETFQFIPYIDESAEDTLTERQVQSYKEQCQLIIKTKMETNFENLSELREKSNLSFQIDDPKHSLLKYLLKQGATDEAHGQDSFQLDILVGNDLLSTERFLRPFVQPFCIENIHKVKKKQVAIREYNEGSSCLETAFRQYFSYETFQVKSYDTLKIDRDSNQSREKSVQMKIPDLIVVNSSNFVGTMIKEKLTSANSQYVHMVLVLSSRPKMVFEANNLTEKCGHLDDANENIISTMAEIGWIMISKRSMFTKCAPICGMLFKRKPEPAIKNRIVRINSLENSWLDKHQQELKSNINRRIWLASGDLYSSGLLGFTRCLHLDEFPHQIHCTGICPGSDVDRNLFDVNFEEKLPTEVLEKDLRVNMYHSSRGWGYYCHLLMANKPSQDSKALQDSQIYYNLQCQMIGDFGSLTWIETSIPPKVEQQAVVNVAYAALNFKDIMLASGRLPQISSINTKHSPISMALGYEFSGFDCNGNRVMGILPDKALSTKVFPTRQNFLWTLPREWSLEDAATVPLVYATVLYALFMRGSIRKGESILIHAGSGGVGLAAINVCLALGCKIWTTCGTKEKRDYLLETFPQLTEADIFSSRDTKFEEQILDATDGRGVDIVVNSLSDEKLQASLRCLAPGGRFLEIGKYDMVRDTLIEGGFLNEGRSFHGVSLESLIGCVLENESDLRSQKSVSSRKQTLLNLMSKRIEEGWIKPLPRRVFGMNQVEEAFRYMACGKHIGKVVIKMNQNHEENQIPLARSAKSVQFSQDKCYIIVGGFGGIGTELALWIAIHRGARHIILNSRSGPKSPYHEYCLERLKNRGVQVVVSTDDLTNYQTVVNIIKTSSLPVGGFFNLAGTLRDDSLLNLTEDDFKKVASSKICITSNFDKASRQYCFSSLDHFVVFSSIASGRGNPGQSNYGHANSSMESICQARHLEHLPALAIQWGAVADVGMVVDTFGHKVKSIGGTAPQRIHSVLQVLDQVLLSEQPVISSMVLAVASSDGSEKSTNIIQELAHLLGINDITSVDKSTTLGQLGIDSLIAIELQQIIDRRFEKNLTSQQIRALTIADLTKFEGEKKIATTVSPKVSN